MENATLPANPSLPPTAAVYSNTKGASARVIASDEECLTYEFTGPKGSATVFIRKYRRHNTLAIARIPLLVGMIGMLPPEAFDALFDEKTVELMLNPDGLIWVEKMGEGMSPVCYMADQFAWEFVRKAAGILDRVISYESPLLNGCLPLDDSRIAIAIPPVTTAPAWAIRKHTVQIFTLIDYVTDGILSAVHCQVIRDAVSQRKNILIIGGCGSGKTTFANAVLREITDISPNNRQIIIEDTAELRSYARNKVNFHISEFASVSKLVQDSLRFRPDRIIVGEVRGGDAWDLLQVWNTGHPGGVATLHANDCASGLTRLKDLACMNPGVSPHVEYNISLGVDLLVNIVKDDLDGEERRMVAGVAEVREFDPNLTENNGFRLKWH
ncbi:MAG: P-type conjugative transfer ATPase TrbB [Planctomycetota bacterium]|jgi:type IV secretion system protein VirB11|nr:P-type conjugative transfer ATPase TrbB [Planctomycetota bacterium]